MKNIQHTIFLSFLLLFGFNAFAGEAEIKRNADEATQAAKDDLKALDQSVGEGSGSVDEQSSTAQEDKAQAKKDEASSKPWLPVAKDFDWVQLTSGEWLKGEIKAMYNDSLEFDSDKLGLQNIDWTDVKYLKSHSPSTVNIEHHEPVTGSLQVSDDVVTITNSDGVQEFGRASVISLTPARESESDLWSIKLSLGFNVKSGNTKQLDYISKLNVKRRTAKTRFVLDYIGNISKTGDGNREFVETVNNHRVNADHNIYVTRYFFYQPIFAEYFRDPFQNIERRMHAGVGVGYTLYNTDKFEWNVSGGPAYIRTRFVSVEPGEPEEVDGPALAFATDLNTELSDTLDFIFKYNILAAKEESGGYTHHMIGTFESEITGSLKFDVSLIWDRISQPTTDRDGNRPKPDDYRLVVGLNYTY
jgi:putative salt-induced outer membrane protein YdiY